VRKHIDVDEWRKHDLADNHLKYNRSQQWY